MKTVWKVILIIAAVLFVLGLALVAGSLFSGGGLRSLGNNVAMTNYEANFEGEEVHTLRLNLGAGELNVLPGDTLRVEAENVVSNDFVCEIQDGVLTVEETWSNSWSDNISRWLSLRERTTVINLYLPADHHLTVADITVAAGNCRLESLVADRADLRLSAGRLEVEGLTSGQVDMNVAAGAASLRGLSADSFELDLSAGAATVSGSVALSCKVDVAAGTASLELTGSAGDYTADIDAGAGSIDYGGNRFQMQELILGQGPGVMELDCGAGSISVRFTD